MLEKINMILCGFFMPFALIALGIFFMYKLKFFYILHPFKTLKVIIKNQGKSGFKSLSVALAGTLGVGNIVGVASAIAMGGAGAVFWMWLSALCAMSVKYAEVFLGIRFRHSDGKTNYGGAPYYINEGMYSQIGVKSAKIVSLTFAFLCIANSLTTGNLMQINAVSFLIPIPSLAFGAVFAFFIFIIVIGGIERIGKFSSKLIPILSLTYIAVSLYIIFANISYVPQVFSLIFKDAFSVKSAFGGFSGYGILRSVRFGVSRGILSNEAGCGTSPTAHASSKTESEHAQGCLGILEVFIDTIVLCTITALVILLSKGKDAFNNMDLVISSYEQLSGSLGKYTVIISSVLFAFATVCTQFFYGAESLKYITKSTKAYKLYTLTFFAVCVFASVIPISVMWQISDTVIGTMTLIHIICLLFLHKYVTNNSHF